MKKILDILIIVWLTVLVINLFSGKQDQKTASELIFSTTDKSYTVPASVILNVSNNTENDITLNTCDNIKINKLWEELLFDWEFCKDLVITSKEKQNINYWDKYEHFFDIWNYVFKINLNEKEYLQQFEINNPWTIRKIFVYIFYAPIYNLLIFLINLFWWYLGWAIIAITILIRLLLLYPQHKMMLSQKKLQAIQPKIKEIQKQYKWQQQVLWVKLMELYKKEKVNPMWSCWFLFIQMPILLVVYNVILSIKDLSNYYYLYPSLSSFDLQSVSYQFQWLDLLSKWWVNWMILALLVWSIQFIQIKLSLANKESQNKKWVILEKKKWKDDYSQFMPEPEMINKFMLYWMPVMVTIFTYNLIAWVWLYWWISTLFMVFQQLFVNKVLNKSSNNS